ncbi:hypothetical protein HYY69_08270 [Candidatus Woesearchaeota archaeon]|nr:hypothetical protein [Candidatus Woesearchaeota archaeon]
MYENDYKNATITFRPDLEAFLQLLADLDKDIELFALGGTAMILANIKESTKDIDFLTTLDYEQLRILLQLAGLKEKNTTRLCNTWFLNNLRIDFFYDAFILGYSLPDDWKKLSIQLKSIGKIRLYILNWYDIIITKLSRSEERDINDILFILKTQKIDFAILKKRYYQYAPSSLISDYDLKFKHLEFRLGEL